MSSRDLAVAVDRVRKLPYVREGSRSVKAVRRALIAGVVQAAPSLRERYHSYIFKYRDVVCQETVRSAFVGLGGLKYVASSMELDHVTNLHYTHVVFQIVDVE